MIGTILITVPPLLFLAILFGGGAVLRRVNIDIDGEPPINRGLFYGSKYAMLFLWALTILASWGVKMFPIRVPAPLSLAAICLWLVGFALLFAGRFRMGASFRIGSPKEETDLQTGGLFRLSRNPMYLGVFSTLIAASLYTLNPVVIAIAVFVAAVHHRIVLAEEEFLGRVFGEKYRDYSKRVRRYL